MKRDASCKDWRIPSSPLFDAKKNAWRLKEPVFGQLTPFGAPRAINVSISTFTRRYFLTHDTIFHHFARLFNYYAITKRRITKNWSTDREPRLRTKHRKSEQRRNVPRDDGDVIISRWHRALFREEPSCIIILNYVSVERAPCMPELPFRAFQRTFRSPDCSHCTFRSQFRDWNVI